MPIDLFRGNDSGRGEAQNTDSSLLSAARNQSTVGTAQPINGFIPTTKGDVDSAKEDLKKRVEQSRFFRQLLAINLKWQKVDIADTKALTKWRTATVRNLMAKTLVVARGAAQQEALNASFAQKAQALRESTDQKINDLNQRKQAAKEKVRR